MSSESSKNSISPTERMLRKRQAARLRQQRCRARKKELSATAKQQQQQTGQQEGKSAAHIPAVSTRRPLLSAMAGPLPPYTATGHRHPSTMQQPSMAHHHHHLGKPHQPHQPHQPHKPHQPHRRPHQIPHHPNMLVPPPPGRSRHHLHAVARHHHMRPPQLQQSQPPYGNGRSGAIHRPMFTTTGAEQQPMFPTRMQSIGSVVSFDDGSCPVAMPFPLKMADIMVPPVSPTETAASKPIVEPDATAIKTLSVPASARTPSKEETAIRAMLSLRSASFDA